MNWPTRSKKVYTDLVASWLRSDVEKLNSMLAAIERAGAYNDDYIYETIRSAELSIRQVRKYIEAN